MNRFVALGLLSAMGLGLWAQETPNLFQSAAPEVNEALRKRVSDFYKLLEVGRFRQTDAYLAEDAKDVYYEQEKRRIRGHEIVRVNWADGFTKAVVVTVLQTDVVMRGSTIAVAAPISSRWRLEGNQWVMYFETTAGKPSPFGSLKAGPNQTNGLTSEELIKNPSVIFNQITVEKDVVRLKSYEKSSDSILVSNGMPGGITVLFVPNLVNPGFRYRVEKQELGAGEKTKIVFEYDPGIDLSAKTTITGQIRIEPFSKAYPIVVMFDVPDSVKRLLPK